MATSFLKKTMVYLGLLDDEYDEYDEYDDRSPRGFSAASQRADGRMSEIEEVAERPAAAPMGRIRALPHDGAAASGGGPAPATITARPASPSVRPMSPGEPAKVQVVAPTRFGDAKDIADCLKANRPVIVNLQVADRDLQRRMIDFCSGVTYALSGEMEKVAEEVFLLAPTNVKVSEEERQRLQEPDSVNLEMGAIFGALAAIVEVYVVVLIVRALLSWFPAPPGSGLERFVHLLDTITEPVLRPIRRMLPPIGVGGMGIDLSIFIVVILAQVVVIPLLRA